MFSIVPYRNICLSIKRQIDINSAKVNCFVFCRELLFHQRPRSQEFQLETRREQLATTIIVWSKTAWEDTDVDGADL